MAESRSSDEGPDAVEFRGRTRSVLSGWPLRSRLVVLLMTLVALALAVSGFAAVAALRGYLIGEVDRGLAEATMRMADAGPLRPAPSDLPGGGFGDGRPAPTGRELTYVRIGDAGGTQYQTLTSSDLVDDPPELPAVSVQAAVASGGEAYEVDSVSGDSTWRAITVPMADGSGTVTAAVDISGIQDTVTRLAVIELVIGAIVLALLGITGWVLVRRSLRPLDDVEHAAAAIAAGDLTHRAPAADPRTEVGSLALSFNTMVDSVQAALTSQQESERAARGAEATARESEAAARASEERMRQFVADASHELRTPLTSVRGFAELYRIGATPPGPRLDDSMARIEAESERMGVLVEDLLLLARLDQQRPLQRRDVDLLGLVADAVAAARAAAPGRDVLLELDPEAAVAVVAGDAHRLRQVVDNLLSNALRYSPPDEPVVARIGCATSARSGERWARIEVTDRGPGMAPEEAARVFERFYRADPARSRSHGGAGLGLSIVAAITAAHGGHVDLQTTVGRGSTFQVWLPLARPGSDEPMVGEATVDADDDSTADEPTADQAMADATGDSTGDLVPIV